jgi:hypothetical protein
MPFKDKNKPEIKTRKLTLLKERWDMFDHAKKLAEKELGQMGNGIFLEMLIVSFLQVNDYEQKEKRKTK